MPQDRSNSRALWSVLAIVVFSGVGIGMYYWSTHRQADAAIGMVASAKRPSRGEFKTPQSLLKTASQLAVENSLDSLKPDIRELQVTGDRIDDAWVRKLQRFKDLEVLRLDRTRLTDAGLETLNSLTKLKELSLNGTHVTDAGIPSLQILGGLDRLYLSRTKVTDACLPTIASLTKLRELDLSHTKVSDAGLPQLKTLARLEALDLGATAVTGEGLTVLSAMPKLMRLSLSYTRINDRGLTELGKTSSLRWLDLARTRLRDERLGHLKNLPLLYLSLDGNPISNTGRKQLQTFPLHHVSLLSTAVTEPESAEEAKAIHGGKVYFACDYMPITGTPQSGACLHSAESWSATPPSAPAPAPQFVQVFEPPPSSRTTERPQP